MPCTVCGVGSKRTVREYSAELNIVRYSISVCVYTHSRCTAQSDGGWGLWKGEKKIRIILYVCWCGVSGDTA